MELLLGGQDPTGGDPDPGTLDRVRNRLIDRRLLDEEAAADSVEVAPDDPAVDERFKALLQKFSNPGLLTADLRKIGLDEGALRRHLAEEERVLRVIDERLRPLATVEPSEIESYYWQTFIPEVTKRGKGPAPPLAEVESRIREILTQQKIDKSLADWLKTLRATRDVHVYGKAAAEDNP